MIYFDTNVVLYALEIVQDKPSYVKTAKALFDRSVTDQQAVLSFLNIAETSFVLAKLKVEPIVIADTLEFLSDLMQPVAMDAALMTNFLTITSKTQKYRHSFDLLHIEIARRLQCQQFVTYDQALKKIRAEYQDIEIDVLK